MSFANTYRDAVIDARRDRSRRAKFLARILMMVTVVLVAAILRTQPELRNTLTEAAMNAALTVMNDDPSPDQAAAPYQPVPQQSARPRDRVKVNRPAVLQVQPRTDF